MKNMTMNKMHSNIWVLVHVMLYRSLCLFYNMGFQHLTSSWDKTEWDSKLSTWSLLYQY